MMNNLFEINKEGESARILNDSPPKERSPSLLSGGHMKSGAMKISDGESEKSDELGDNP